MDKYEKELRDRIAELEARRELHEAIFGRDEKYCSLQAELNDLRWKLKGYYAQQNFASWS